MKGKKLWAIVVGLIILVSPIAVWPFDREPGSLKGFEYWAEGPDYQEYETPPFIDVSGSFTKCLVLGTAEGFYADFDKDGNLISRRAVGVYGQEGSTFYIGNGYWVTNTHVIKPASVTIEITKNFSVITYPVRIISRVIMVGQGTGLGSAPAELVYVDEERDIAIIKVIGNWPAFIDPGYRPVFTQSDDGDELLPGIPVAVIVAVRTNLELGDLNKTPWFEVRYGTIISGRVVLPEGLPTDILPWFSMNDVTMTTLIYPGDSGSPVFAWIEGKPVIIGVARAAGGVIDPVTGELHYYSYFTRIDIVVPFVIEQK